MMQLEKKKQEKIIFQIIFITKTFKYFKIVGKIYQQLFNEKSSCCDVTFNHGQKGRT